MEIADLVLSMPARLKVPSEFLRSVAVHELGHAIVGVLVDADKLVSVTIEDSIDPRTSTASLGYARFREEPISRKTSTYFEDKIAVLMAGMAAERVVFGDHSNGAAGHQTADLNQATDLATMIEVTWAFGKTLTSEVLSKSEDLADVRSKREGLARVVESTLRKQLERSEAILKEYRDVLDRLTDRLIAEKSLTAADVIEAVRLADHVPRAMTG
jgi:ATP-dependent Zn protease